MVHLKFISARSEDDFTKFPSNTNFMPGFHIVNQLGIGFANSLGQGVQISRQIDGKS